ncbi:MAG: 3-demethylubiquinol 3-O-methyltransferase @ 2-polyprenyl-6-hydroxyphenyl methylase, partial [uncultured Sphingomonas sp.]
GGHKHEHRRARGGALRSARRRLVGPAGRVGHAAPAEPRAAALRPRSDRPALAGRQALRAAAGGQARAGRRLRRGAAVRAAGSAGRGSHGGGCRAPADRRGGGACRRPGARHRLPGLRGRGDCGRVRPGDGNGGDRACRLPRAVPARPRRAAGPGRAADPLDPQPHGLGEAADHHAGRGVRADPARHARLRQLHPAGADNGADGRGGAAGRRYRGDRLLAQPGAAPERRPAPQLSGERGAGL